MTNRTLNTGVTKPRLKLEPGGVRWSCIGRRKWICIAYGFTPAEAYRTWALTVC